jgi:isopenicillin-N N-acyltransferase-like protein
MGRIRELELRGAPRAMGRQHGRAFRDNIRKLTAERVHLSSDPKWTGQAVPRARVLELAEACLAEHIAYAPHLIEEVQGIADETGLSLAELIILNGFTDFTDTLYALGGAGAHGALPQPALQAMSQGCTAFIAPDTLAADGRGFYGQTWDMHASATPHVILLRVVPEAAPAALMFTITGCIGMIGMNAAGIAIGINMLSGTDGRVGVTWPFVVRQVLAQTDFDAALECITSAKLAGAHNYMLFDKHGRGANVEAMATCHAVTLLNGQPLVHTNHCLADFTAAVEQERDADLQASSAARLADARGILARGDATPQSLMALTRDPRAICRTADPVYHVETCGAAIMRPASGDFWAVWGVPSQNEYEHFRV